MQVLGACTCILEPAHLSLKRPKKLVLIHCCHAMVHIMLAKWFEQGERRQEEIFKNHGYQYTSAFCGNKTPRPLALLLVLCGCSYYVYYVYIIYIYHCMYILYIVVAIHTLSKYPMVLHISSSFTSPNNSPPKRLENPTTTRISGPLKGHQQ